jgi:predicted nucleic acid-binding Zn ribbon protein
MAEVLPLHDHCAVCDDPIEVGERFCSDKCRLEHEKELRKERNKNTLFMVVVIGLFAAIAAGYYFLG